MKTETQPPRLGDILKSEADVNSRTYIYRDDVKIGDVVKYGLGDTSRKLIALSNSEHGKVLIQPHNCLINLDALDQEKIKSDVQDLISQGDKFGIQYIGKLVPSENKPTVEDSNPTVEETVPEDIPM